MPMGDATDNQKARLRRALEARRRGIAAADLTAASVSACAAVADSAVFRGARHVVLYAARPGELDPSAIEAAAARAGVPTFYPRVDEAGMTFRRARRDELGAGRWGLREPDEHAAPLDPAAPHVLVVVPGVAFDRCGHRLGTGRGYYDRALPALHHARRVGLVLGSFVVDAIPFDVWDVPMDAVATEHGLFFVGGRAGDHPGDHAWT
jgi:5-formyltetrahydrofolate cyclo-ligase